MTAKDRNLKAIEGGEKWERELIRDGRRLVVNNLANLARILRSSPEWQGALAFNEASQEIELSGGGPCLKGTFPRAWREGDEQILAIWFQTSIWRLNATPGRVLDAVLAVARERSYNPIKQHLLALRWDGVRRLDGWLIVYAGVDESKYARAVGTAWLRSVAARGLTPGAKVDAALILEGLQGRFKSTAFRILGGPFYIEIQDVVGDRAVQNMAGKLIAEMSELDALDRREASATKASITIQSDRIRLPYARRASDLPRTAVLCGTSNKGDYLRDETGNRRYWPVKVATVDIAALARDRDQLLAEAVADVQAGEPWHLIDRGIQDEAAEAVQARRHVDVWEDDVAHYLGKAADRAKGSGLALGDVLYEALGLQKKSEWGQAEQNRAARILRAHGWERRYKRLDDGKRQWRYYPPEPDAPTPPPPGVVPGEGGGSTNGSSRSTQETSGGSSGSSGSSRKPSAQNQTAEVSSSSLTSTGTTGTTGTKREKQGVESGSTSGSGSPETGTDSPQAIYASLLASGYPDADARELAGLVPHG